MKVVVIGGTGLIGSKVVSNLRAAGHEAIAASPESGVNTITGEGLAGVLAGARVVVDVSNAPSFADADVLSFFETSTRTLLAAEAKAGVAHHVALSVVGADRTPDSGYLRAKVAQENLIKGGSVPWSIVRSTQFFEFLGRIADDATDDGSVRLSPAQVQPIAASDVAAAVSDVAVGEPAMRIIEIAGPEHASLNELVARYFSSIGDPRKVVADPSARYYGARLTDRSLTPGADPRIGGTTFATWVRTQPRARGGMTRTVREESVPGTRGLKLFVRSWRPDTSPRGVVVIVPGFNAHGGHYLWVGEQLAARGLAVYAIDLHGRGRSEGERFFLDRFADYLTDVHAVLTLARTRDGGLPIFVLGHSAGGVVATIYALDHQAELAGLICESSAFQVPTPGIVLGAVSALSQIAPHVRMLRLKNELFSRDPRVVQALNADPLIAREVQPAKTLSELWRATQRIDRDAPRFRLPLLVLHGTEDKVTKPSGSQRFHQRAGSTDKRLKLYPGHFHDPLNDVDKELVLADIQAWLDVHLAPFWSRPKPERPVEVPT